MHLYQQSLAFAKMAFSFIPKQNECPVKARGFLFPYIIIIVLFPFREVIKLNSSTEE